MIHKISNFRVYAAIHYNTQQIYSMSWTIPSFPHNELFELVNLSKQKINRNWETSIGISCSNNINIIISNAIKLNNSENNYGVGVYRLIESEIQYSFHHR